MTDVWTHFRQTLFCSENNIFFIFPNKHGWTGNMKKTFDVLFFFNTFFRKYRGWCRAPARRKVKVKSIPSALANMSHQQNQQNECAPSEDSDQHEHPPNLIKIFAVRSMGSYGRKVSSCGQRRLSDQTGRMPRLI